MSAERVQGKGLVLDSESAQGQVIIQYMRRENKKRLFVSVELVRGKGYHEC
jgi:hypothetical protein